MVNGHEDSREQGIEFGTLAGYLEDESYPLSHETLISRYGESELDLNGNQTTLREVLSPDQAQEYDDAESVRQAVFNMVEDAAVGRENYSDRGGSHPDVCDSTEPESL